MTRFIHVLAPLLVVACASSKPTPVAPVAKTATIDCTVVAEHGVGAESFDKELDAKAKSAVAASCVKNAWSEESKRCIVDSAPSKPGDDCNKLLSESQQQALQADLAAAFANEPGVTVQTSAASPPPGK